MMRTLTAPFFILLIAILLGCSKSDPIDRLMKKVPYEAVPGYLFVPIKLSKTASPDQCISVLAGRLELYNPRILKIRPVQYFLEPEHKKYIQRFTAVLVDTDKGQKIVLLQPLRGTNNIG